MKNLNPGDIIFTDRIFYKHYGVYAGEDRVIHYSSSNGDFGLDACVRETSLEQFARGGYCNIVEFTEKSDQKRLFSKEETMKRASSRLGEKQYNLIFNNCEHFAIWCKTGENKSFQVEKAVTAAVLLGATIIVTKLIADLYEET
ncbi:MAG: lecithin retinol acyltransferase family protein [Treponema sp.]|nr:lecithin retinol acyltransferase family protein [Treponema sp.]